MAKQPAAHAKHPALSSHAQQQMQALLDQLVADGRETGIQVAAYRGEQCVVDAYAGRTDTVADAAPVTASTLFPVFSLAKAAVSMSAHLQAEKGLLDLEAPIARYWPTFGAHGKEHVTIMDVLTHRAGVPQMPANSTVERVGDWEWIATQIAALQPYCEPGRRSFYHAMTYAWILGELVRRTDPAHRPFERFVREEIFAPLAIDSFHFTVVPPTSTRVAKLSGAGYPNPPDGSPMRIGMPASLI